MALKKKVKFSETVESLLDQVEAVRDKLDSLLSSDQKRKTEALAVASALIASAATSLEVSVTHLRKAKE